MKKSIYDLKPHPMNAGIYGASESVAGLKEKIRGSGEVATVVINSDNVIISGHRRVRACLELAAEGDERFKELECEVREFGSENDELRYLIMCNDTREKTLEQRVREAKGLLEIERAEAELRKKSGTKIDLVATLPQGSKNDKKGKSRDIVAQSIGIKSGRELERFLFAIETIDELAAQNRISDAELIRETLNNGSASAAEKLAKNIDTLSDEDKRDIRDKKISVNKAVNKTAPKISAAGKPRMPEPEGACVPEEAAGEPKELKVPESAFLGWRLRAEQMPKPADKNVVLSADIDSAEEFAEILNSFAKWLQYFGWHDRERFAAFAQKILDWELKKDENTIRLFDLLLGVKELRTTVEAIRCEYYKECGKKQKEEWDRQDEEREKSERKRREEINKTMLANCRKAVREGEEIGRRHNELVEKGLVERETYG